MCIMFHPRTARRNVQILVLRGAHSHFAALHAHVALCIQDETQPLVSNLPTAVSRPVCAPLIETRNFRFTGWIISNILMNKGDGLCVSYVTELK